MISDIVLLKELPREVKRITDSTSCVAGAMMKDEYLSTVEAVGFENVRVVKEEHYTPDLESDPDATVLVFNKETNSTEAKKVSELDDKAKQRLKETLREVSSINVLAIKP